AAEPLPIPSLGEAIEREWVREEIACVLRLAPCTAGSRLHDAFELVERLPATLAALECGDITLLHARSLVEAIDGLDDTTTAKVEQRVLATAAAQTVGNFRQAVKRAVLALDPRAAEEKHRDAVAQRRVVATPQDDGTSELWALLPADDAAALMARLNRIVDQTKGLDARTADQRRADALLALATGNLEQNCGAAVLATVAASTLLGLDDQPGELEGHGPIPAALAREIAHRPDSTWRRLLTDPAGQLIDYGTNTYRPPAPLARHVRARDRTCRFPGCNRRARRCELDHITARHNGRPTNQANLHCLCPRHHHLKHDAGWTVSRQPNGTTEWTSPTGRRYEKSPDKLPF
ncbi:MAG: hypothetical protein QOF92_1818, partial [Pseudonocardiales bacterium]|nr:hypothetical protein [Pseudonocardiales bacterium]